MYFLIYLVTIIIVYVASFKEDFKKENIEKVSAVLVIIAVLTVLLSLLNAILA